ncbi:MAG: hypothetical protein G01um101438_278 [Parcubacteria group bacterium Gr01-1014_38]|nr:MAG: hypothetical protein G01um101438_278 [Parcubacteria group bacterium Gr01-1014_38]
MTLQKLMEHSFSLYARRNRVFLPSLRDRIDYLNLAIGDLQDAIRKEFGRDVLGCAVARIVSRIFCVAEHFWNLPETSGAANPFVIATVRKYPRRCSYCGQSPCACSERHSESQLAQHADPEQLQWTLRQWCAHLDHLYGAMNRKRGLENMLNRLFREISELSSLAMKISRLQIRRDQIEDELALELADALAWTIAIACVLGIDLEDAFTDQYQEGCQICRCHPCECTHFHWEPMDWRTFNTSS